MEAIETKLKTLIKLIYPPKCTFCEDIIVWTAPEPICQYCKKDYPLIVDPSCLKCGRQLVVEKDLCIDCSRQDHVYDRGQALYSYEEAVKETIYRFKYGGKVKYAKFFAEKMHQQLEDTVFYPDVDFIVPVPLSKERFAKRGFNQAEEIAKHLSKISGIAYNNDILKRVKDTKAQSELKPSERKANIQGVFQEGDFLDLEDKNLLIIDDIYTTGSTLDECARVLKNAKAGKVYFSVICIGKPK